MYCSKCGKENNDNNIYCNYCGTKLQLDTNKLSSDRFVIENNTTVDIAGLIITIISYVWLIKLLGPGVLDSSFPINLFALVELAVFTIMCVGYLYSLSQKSKAGKYSLIIDKDGITDYYSLTAIGFIPWTDIQDIYISKNKLVKIKLKHISKTDIVKIKLKDEDKYLNKVSIIPRIIMLFHKKLGSEIIQIPLLEDQLPKTLLQEMFKKDSNITDNVNQVNSDNDTKGEIVSNYTRTLKNLNPTVRIVLIITFIIAAICITSITINDLKEDNRLAEKAIQSLSSSTNKGISRSNYDKITEGMTYYEVISIMGNCDNKQEYTSSGYNYMNCTWSSPDFSVNAVVMFENGKVSSKSWLE